MNKFGLHTFGLPSFDISDFRLTSFGGDGDGGRKAAFHNSLVDAWLMSGYSNSDKPKEIVGVRGNAIELNNFLYSDKSGFNEVDGSLMFDGVDDYTGDIPLVNSEKGTIIIKYFVPIEEAKGRVLSNSRKINDSWFKSCFIVFPSLLQMRDPSGNSTVEMGTSKGEEHTVALTWDNNGMKITSYTLGVKTEKSSVHLNKANEYGFGKDWNSPNYCNFRLYYVGNYSEPLSTQEIEEEKIKLEQKWKSKLK